MPKLVGGNVFEVHLVGIAVVLQVTVNRSQHELVLALAIDGADPLVLRAGASDHQPVVRCTLEVQIANFKLELCVACWYVRTLLILGNKLDVFQKHAGVIDGLKKAAADLATEYLLTSAKTGERVEESFLMLAKMIGRQ